LRNPRINLYREQNGFKIFIVDGSYIRKHLNSEFTNFAQHYRFPNMIPVKEFWLDKEASPDESEYFIAHLFKEWELMKKGKPYDNALESANKVEHALRNKKQDKKYKIARLDDIGDVGVFLVDGRKIRDDCHIDFTEGGHDLVYNWIPEKEIWIDNDVSPEERAYILAHEYKERCDMEEKGLPYNPAHRKASFFERQLRHQYPKMGKIQPSKKIPKELMRTLGSME